MCLGRRLATLGVVLLLSACAAWRGEAPSPEAQLNRQVPPAPETRAARERLLALLAHDPAAQAGAQRELDERLARRARACLPAGPGVPDPLAVDRDCLRRQDEALRHHLGLRSVGVLLARPALRPAAALGAERPLVHAGPGEPLEIVAAAEAGVAALRSTTGHLRAIELPSGRVIGELPRGLGYGDNSTLSPNGRVLAMTPAGQSTVYLDVETGARLWDAPTAARPLAWLPGLGAFLQRDEEGWLQIADTERGELRRHPRGWHHPRYAVAVAAVPGRVVVGGERIVGVEDHQRGPAGIVVQRRALYRLSAPGVTDTAPLLMRDGGLLVHHSLSDLAWLDLRTGAQGSWVTAPHFGRELVKLDEQHLMLDAEAMADRPRQAWRLDVVRNELAPLPGVAAATGRLAPLGLRAGYVRLGQPWRMGDQVEAGAGEPFDAVVARLQSRWHEVTTAALTDHGRRPLALADSLAPALRSLPENSLVELVGLSSERPERPERPEDAPAAGPGRRPAAEAHVLLRPSPRPVVLVLSSVEPVDWEVIEGGGPLAAVLLSGTATAKVRGADRVPVVHIGPYVAPSAEGPAWERLRRLVERYTGPLEIGSLRSAREGGTVVVGE